jgi:glutamate dehydrogenase/leucine dehydrogenase
VSSGASWHRQLADAEHESVTVVRNRLAGLRAVIAIHSTVLGPALGGVRLLPYPTFGHAVEDVLRLSRAMTSKAALAGLDFGGGKAVILGDPAAKTPALIEAFGDAVDALGGRYVTAEDVGTDQGDMDRIRRRTPHVTGTATARGGSGDPSPFTARGVLRAMQAAGEAAWGAGLQGRRALVIGVGKVWGALVELLVAEGAEVLVSDVDAERVGPALEAGAAGVVPADSWDDTVTDVLSPCALGGDLTAERAGSLGAAVVVGGANNQLASPEVAELLHAAGTLYVPDFVANAGGIINIAEERKGYDAASAARAVDRIGDTTRAVLALASREGVTTVEAADRLVATRLASAAASRR